MLSLSSKTNRTIITRIAQKTKKMKMSHIIAVKVMEMLKVAVSTREMQKSMNRFDKVCTGQRSTACTSPSTNRPTTSSKLFKKMTKTTMKKMRIRMNQRLNRAKNRSQSRS